MAATGGGGGDTAEVEVTVARPLRVLHFSDGVEEEFEEAHAHQLSASPAPEPVLDPSTMSWGPWLSHYAWKSGEKVLGAVDYAGEGLASFFGITTPKYQIEIDEHERLQEEKRQMDAESVGWVAKETDGQIPLVMNAPTRETDRPTVV